MPLRRSSIIGAGSKPRAWIAMRLKIVPRLAKSALIASLTPGYCTLTATGVPSCSSARCTWPIEAAAYGHAPGPRSRRPDARRLETPRRPAQRSVRPSRQAAYARPSREYARLSQFAFVRVNMVVKSVHLLFRLKLNLCHDDQEIGPR